MSVVEVPMGALAVSLPKRISAEAECFARACRGDATAFEEIVRVYQTRVFNLAFRMLRNHEEAEDVTQEAFVKAYEYLPTLREARALRTWLYRITASICLSRLRSASYRREIVTEISTQFADEDIPEESELSQVVQEALAQLPAHYRWMLEACYLKGYSYKETARLAGVEMHTFKTRLFRARQHLRARLAEVLEQYNAGMSISTQRH